MFLTRLGRKIGLHLKSVSGNLESLDIWKIIEILASCNCDLDTVDTIEQSKLSTTAQQSHSTGSCEARHRTRLSQKTEKTEPVYGRSVWTFLMSSPIKEIE